MKNLLLFLLLACWAHAGLAQRGGATTNAVPGGGGTTAPPDRYRQHADSLFQYIDRSQVSTGLLTNYGFALKNYNLFQGTALSQSNLLQHLDEWRLLYAAMQTSIFNTNATLPPLPAVNLRIRQAGQTPDIVPIATLLARYDRFRDEAGTAGLVTVSNGQLHDAPNRPRSPYEQRTLVALSPLASKVATRSPQFSFSGKLLFTNAAPAISMLEFDAGEGQGYRPAAWDQPLTATYPANGTYTLRFRLTCADGSVLLSQARFDVSQPPAARYGSAGSTNVVTYNSNALFTDTRPYTPINGFLAPFAATGKVTVAYASSNFTGTIRKPLIVIEGYDPSAALRANGLSARKAPDYDYNYFVQARESGAILTPYSLAGPGDKNNFNDQLSEVGEYDLIFLNFDNGTDYIQRNAFLVERLIQWVNDTKEPLNGTMQQNIVLGMSMGGLVARYALRDMEKRQAAGQAIFGHDTRLYISHEAPHQGANVPLGFQYLVSKLTTTNLGLGLTAGDFSPALKAFASLLNEPATQQLLLYQTTAAGTNLHNAWLNEYNNTMGYPTQCRNVATSDGSECGRPQPFGPHAELLNIQGSGLLDEPYNGYANTAVFGVGLTLATTLGLTSGGLGFAIALGVGTVFALGNFEGKVDFVVNALPNQQRQRIYHGKFTICKEILFGLFSSCLVDYVENVDSDASMLPYDSAPGGLYDIDQLSGNLVGEIGSALPIPVTRISLQPKFCFVPTTSALDIGGGSVALGPQNLTAAYSGATPPAPPFNTPFANFITASRENLTHILWNGLNSKWAFQEMQGAPQVFSCQAFCAATPTISGPDVICAGTGSTFTVAGLPPGTSVTWSVAAAVPYTPLASTASGYTVASTGTAGLGTVQATLNSDCGTFTLAKPVAVGKPNPRAVKTSGPGEPTNYTFTAPMVPGASYNWYVDNNLISDENSYELFYYFGCNVTHVISYAFANDCNTTGNRPSATRTGECRPRARADAGTTATLYPNPAKETVDVHLENADAAPVTVRLFDSYGQPRTEQTSHGETTLRLNTEKLPTGLYFVHILRGQQVLSRQQLRIEK